jgi:hypothetical protein
MLPKGEHALSLLRHAVLPASCLLPKGEHALSLLRHALLHAACCPRVGTR